jgi:hypothetical protein
MQAYTTVLFWLKSWIDLKTIQISRSARTTADQIASEAALELSYY